MKGGATTPNQFGDGVLGAVEVVEPHVEGEVGKRQPLRLRHRRLEERDRVLVGGNVEVMQGGGDSAVDRRLGNGTVALGVDRVDVRVDQSGKHQQVVRPHRFCPPEPTPEGGDASVIHREVRSDRAAGEDQRPPGYH